jgi:arsenite-transporting ATPase
VNDGPALIARLAPVTLVVGKGGVGKTTVAAALASHFASAGQRTLVVTTDPAGTLLTALGQPLVRTTRPVRLRPALDAWAFDTAALRDEFLATWRDPVSTILDRGTYLDADDIAGLVDAALPGADEIFAVLTLGDVLAKSGPDAYERVIVDTAPTGHTLRLLTLPRSFDALVRLLDAMQEKHRFMVRALTHRYRSDAADALIADLRERVDALQKILTDRRRCAAVLVTRPERVVLAETERYAAALQLAGIAVVATVVNVADSAVPETAAAPGDVFRVPTLDDPSTLLSAMGAPTSSRASALPATTSRAASSDSSAEMIVASARSLTVVGGKGGVGKTTTACAVALRSAETGHRTLLVSTDPAPSVGDALGLSIGDAEVEVAPNLAARQMDATSAFNGFRDQYRDRIEGLFEGLAGRGVDIAHDREIIRDLMALAPPGIDELYALTVLGEELEKGRFDRIVIDPAPTGHLLRLLDMPAMAVEWSHQLMRMMLKYREVVGLGEAAQDLLVFAKRTRALDERFHDRQRSATILVALDEPLVREETSRLTRELASRGLNVGGILWNRASAATPPLPTDQPIPQFFAPPASPPPVGIAAIRRWASTWGSLSAGHR